MSVPIPRRDTSTPSTERALHSTAGHKPRPRRPSARCCNAHSRAHACTRKTTRKLLKESCTNRAHLPTPQSGQGFHVAFEKATRPASQGGPYVHPTPRSRVSPTGARDRALHAQKSAHHAAATTPRNKWHTRGKVLHALHGPRRRDTWRQFENSNASLKLSGRPLIAKTHAHHIAAHTLACGSARSRQPPLDRARRQQAPTGGCLQPPWRLEANYGHGHRAHQGVRG